MYQHRNTHQPQAQAFDQIGNGPDVQIDVYDEDELPIN
jgi:hypothetical protein